MNRKPLALAAATLFSLSAFAAQADTRTDGDGSGYPATASAPSTLTREAVIADLVAARKNGTLPNSGDWSDVPAPLALSGQSSRAPAVARDQVRAEAVAAARSHDIVSGDH
ncbi:DUF4148 domain-containing protein [Paracidovorax anthurii]|uniref:Uncharacterized protein DUF4148 n=1 Tax=Paracidovorax anthurii TaxID=78229 RepID=A0A328YSX4_9BURK|nr:DUF4148 domain-containing protein [Paracidovorax anthurii]RAR77088.1 uncharacterized protein DUF4148 [Paracidovorax anthurii]